MATKLAENTVTEIVAPTGTVIKSVARALDILETLSAASGNMPLSKLSAATGLNNSTCHHLISTLAAREGDSRCLCRTGVQRRKTTYRHGRFI